MNRFILAQAIVSGFRGWVAWLLILAAARGPAGAAPPPHPPAAPAAPSQTALLIHEAGMETLLLKPVLQSAPGQTGAWILPLPAAPESVAVGDPGTLGTLLYCIGPKPGGAPRQGWRMLCAGLAFLLAVPLSLRLLDTRRAWRQALLASRRGPRLVILAAVALAALLGVAALAAMEQTAPPGPPPPPQQATGSYSLSTLKVGSRSELDDWLVRRGLAPTPDALAPLVEDYAGRGWYFLLASLDQARQPAPPAQHLLLRFKTPEAVYPLPLDLTGAGDGGVNLYVAGRGRYHHPLLETVFADQFLAVQTLDPTGRSVIPGRRGKTTAACFAHPELLRVVPDGMWITALRSAPQPARPHSDLRLQSIAPEASRHVQKIIYTRSQALATAGFWMLLCFAVGSPLWAGFCRFSPRPGLDYLVLPAAVLLLGVVMMAGGLPTSPARPLPRQSPPPPGSHLETMRSLYEQVMSEPAAETDGPARRLRERLTREAINPLSQEPVREEASPGNFTLNTDAKGRVLLNVYDQYGRPLPVPPAKPPQES